MGEVGLAPGFSVHHSDDGVGRFGGGVGCDVPPLATPSPSTQALASFFSLLLKGSPRSSPTSLLIALISFGEILNNQLRIFKDFQELRNQVTSVF